MARIFPTISLLCWSALAQAQPAGVFRGRVLDPSGAVVASASVTLHQRDGSIRRTAVTSGAGEFHFEGLPAAEYLVEVRAQGFDAARTEAVVLAAGAGLERDLRLELERVSQRVVVTAAGTPQSTEDVSKALDVLDAASVQQRAEISLVEALRTVPGMRIQQMGGPGSLARIQVRGLRAYDTSLLIDGVRLRDAAAPQGDATAFLSDLLFTDSDRVEVLRGSGSSLHGTHAMGGVVNLVTDQGGGQVRGSISAEGGGLGLFRGAARLAGGASEDRLQYSAGLTHLNVTRGIDGDDRGRNLSGQGFLQYRAAPRSLLSARLLAADTFLGLNVNPFTAPLSNLPATGDIPAIPLAEDAARRAEQGLTYSYGNATFVPALNDPDSRRSARFVSTLLAFTQSLAAETNLRLSYHRLASLRDNRDGPGGPSYQPLYNNSNRFDGRIHSLGARLDSPLGRRHLLSAGYEWERESYENLSRDEHPDTSQRVNARTGIRQQSHSIFAHQQLRLLSDRLQFSLSGRLQRFALEAPEFGGGAPQYAGARFEAPPTAYTGDGSLAYFLRRSGTKLRAHAGNAYRAPALYERFGTSFYFGSFSPYGDPRLRPERTVAMDAGFDQYLAGSRLRLSGTYFYTRLQEVIVFDYSGMVDFMTDPYGRFAGYMNTRGGLARGVELSAEASPARSLRIYSSYTYTNSRERTSQLVGGSLRPLRLFDHMFTLVATQRVTRRLDATFDLWAGSDYTAPFFAGVGSRPFVFPGPRRGDLALTYSLPAGERHTIQLFTRIENLFNQSYYEEGFRTPKAWAAGGLRYSF